jgi:enterochelin esterase-like enzyme
MMKSSLSRLAALTLGLFPPLASAEDWGRYGIVPVSAPAMVLEAVNAGTADGTVVSINQPSGAAHQKWIVEPNEEGLVAIRPAHRPTLVLAAAQGGAKIGTAIVLETDRGDPWQRWAITRHENGSYRLTPQHAPGLALDDLGGKADPGAKIDLWTARPNDAHLQWFLRPLAGSPLKSGVASEPQRYEPPPNRPEDVRAGVTKQFRFVQSRIFPGTVRDVTVFIPAQYDGWKPACVYVKTDGFNPREQAMMELMIATKEMPVTVGVFVRPGSLPAPIEGTLDRRNRGFEYDGVSDNNVRFFTEELLPFVAKEFALNLSTDGNDRCIAGGSSGGIAAFTAAWHRPEAFSRVYAASGSWVAFRGGHEFPTMVRKFEAKPIRAFLTTGMRDMENAAGDWFLLDQEMDKALKFAGYDYQFRIIDGGHVAGYMDHYREALVYLWRGWPERVKAGPSAPRAQEILIPGETWQLAATGQQDARAPACNAAGEVFFIAKDHIRKLGLDGAVTRLTDRAQGATGLTVAADGRRLYAVSPRTGKIVGYDGDGTPSTAFEGVRGNQILARPDGSLYITSDDDDGSVWRVQDGAKTRVDTGLKHPTGLAYRPDQWLLTVAEGGSKWTCSYQIAKDGTLANKERFFWQHVADWDDDAGAESVCYSREGRLFVATRIGIQITADDGPTQVILPVPDRARVLGVCLGGKDHDTLFAFCGSNIWKRKVQQHAMGAFTPWTKVIGTRL